MSTQTKRKEPMTVRDLNGILRTQAWERAKGELRSVLVSYVQEEHKFERMGELCDEFVRLVEIEGLCY